AAPHASRANATPGPAAAATEPPARPYKATRRRRAPFERAQIGPATPSPARTATAATAAPAPMPAPSTHDGGEPDRNNADRARIITSPGSTNESPPRIAPCQPRSRQAQ